MKKVIATLSLSIVVIAMTAMVGVAQGVPGDQVCPPLDSGKIDVSGENTSLTVTAPPGMEITGYCVKAGSANQGLGAEITDIENTATVTLEHSSGKAISHYSLDLPPPPPPIVPPTS
jgi:hypothetical protein